MTTRIQSQGLSNDSIDVDDLDEDLYRGNYYRAFAVASFKILSKDWRAIVGGSVLAVYLLAGLLGPRVLDEPTTTGPQLVGVFQTWSYPLGTDGLGRDILATTVLAIPPMMLMILSGAIFGTALATSIGVYSAYKRGRIDRILVNSMDVVIAIPGFPLLIVVAAIFEPTNPILIGIIMVINAWAGLARMIRAETFSILEDDYIEASRCQGLSTSNIIGNDVLPNLAPYISIHFVGMARSVIFHSVGLYFLGVLPYTTYNWGRMMNSAYQMGALNSSRIVHWLIVPIVAIILLTTAFTLIAQALDSVFNPRLRTRHAESTPADPAVEREQQPAEIV